MNTANQDMPTLQANIERLLRELEQVAHAVLHNDCSTSEVTQVPSLPIRGK